MTIPYRARNVPRQYHTWARNVPREPRNWQQALNQYTNTIPILAKHLTGMMNSNILASVFCPHDNTHTGARNVPREPRNWEQVLNQLQSLSQCTDTKPNRVYVIPMTKPDRG